MPHTHITSVRTLTLHLVLRLVCGSLVPHPEFLATTQKVEQPSILGEFTMWVVAYYWTDLAVCSLFKATWLSTCQPLQSAMPVSHTFVVQMPGLLSSLWSCLDCDYLATQLSSEPFCWGIGSGGNITPERAML